LRKTIGGPKLHLSLFFKGIYEAFVNKKKQFSLLFSECVILRLGVPKMLFVYVYIVVLVNK
jgi:hypothetical protein